jgi:hypothetical protein
MKKCIIIEYFHLFVFFNDCFHLIFIKTIKERVNSSAIIMKHIISSMILEYEMIEKDLKLDVLKIIYMVVNQVLY